MAPPPRGWSQGLRAGRRMSAGQIRAALFDTGFGVCALAWHEAGVVRFALPAARPEHTRARIMRPFGGAEVVEAVPDGVIAEAVAAVRAHMNGELDDLRWVPVGLRVVTEFHRNVYTVARSIDPGHTLSYGEVASRAGAPGGAQAVGQAMARNPIPLIVPCHRVLAADHALHGFSAPGGIDTKARLLELERTPGFGEPTLF